MRHPDIDTKTKREGVTRRQKGRPTQTKRIREYVTDGSTDRQTEIEMETETNIHT